MVKLMKTIPPAAIVYGFMWSVLCGSLMMAL